MNTIRAGVFIGINNYDEAPLKGARPDAEKMSNFFKDKYDYVDEYFDETATKKNITKYLDCIKSIFEEENKRQRNGLFVFFFSGHGVDRDGRQCLGLADGSEIDLTDIESKTRIPGVKRIFILDCCRVRRRRQDGDWIWELATAPFGAAGNVIRAVRKFWKNLEEHDPDVYPYGCTPPICITSCARGQGSIDTPDGGVFTKVLLSVLRQSKVKSIDSFNRAFSKKFDEEVQKPEMAFPAGIEFNLLPAWEKTSRGNTSGVADKFNKPGDVWQKLVELISSVFLHRHIDAKDTWDTIACWSPYLKDKGGFVDNEMLELALSELQCSIESNFGVKISDSVWRKMKSPCDILIYLTKKISEQSKKKSPANKKASVKKEKGKPFFMEIEDMFSPQKGCKVVFGKIKGGVIRMNDEVEIIGNGCNVSTKVTGIELCDKKGNSKGLFNEAHPGDWAWCLLKNARNLTKVKEGCVLKKQSL